MLRVLAALDAARPVITFSPAMPPLRSHTVALTAEQAETLRAILEEQSFKFEPRPYTLYFAQAPGLTVAVYEKGPKAVIQGKGTQEFVEFTLEPSVLGEARLGYEELHHPERFAPHFGIDESGKGDFFGPLVIAGVYADTAIARHLLDFPDAIDDSFRVFANVRDQRFHEMEYEVPAEAGAACLREVLAKIRDSKVDTFFPLEFRHVKADDVTLSMFQGRDSCAISVHQFYTMDYHNVFAQIEPIFWKYDGRPHWGKLHTLNARQLQPLYPKWKDFIDVRQALDPHGKFLNPHLRSLFGIS